MARFFVLFLLLGLAACQSPEMRAERQIRELQANGRVADAQLRLAASLIKEAEKLGLQCPPIAEIISNPQRMRLGVYALCAPPGMNIPAELRLPPSMQHRSRYGWPDRFGTIGPIPYRYAEGQEMFYDRSTGRWFCRNDFGNWYNCDFLSPGRLH